MATELSTFGLPSSQSRVRGLQSISQQLERNCVGGNVMPNNSQMSAGLEAGSYQSDYRSSLEEQIIGLQSVVAYLLQKSEQLRQFFTAQCKKE